MTVERTVDGSPDPIRLGGVAHALRAQLQPLLASEVRATDGQRKPLFLHQRDAHAARAKRAGQDACQHADGEHADWPLQRLRARGDRVEILALTTAAATCA